MSSKPNWRDPAAYRQAAQLPAADLAWEFLRRDIGYRRAYASAVRHTPENIKAMCKSFMGTRRDMLLKIIIPAASPLIFSGLRLGVSAGFIGAILSELKITPTGVGDIITFSRSIADYPSMYAAIFSIIVLAVLFLNLLERTEKQLFKGNDRGYVSD